MPLDATPMGDVSDDAITALWCAVLRQSVEDATAPRPSFSKFDVSRLKRKPAETKGEFSRRVRTKRIERIRAHKSAINEWRRDRDYIGSSGYQEVCGLCGIEPEAATPAILARFAADHRKLAA